MRDKLLNETMFFSLSHAKAKITEWVSDHNLRRPHSALGYQTPVAFAASLSAICDRLRNPNQPCRPHATPAPHYSYDAQLHARGMTT